MFVFAFPIEWRCHLKPNIKGHFPVVKKRSTLVKNASFRLELIIDNFQIESFNIWIKQVL